MSHEDPSRPEEQEPGRPAAAGGPEGGMTEEELRAQLDEELRRIKVEDVLLQTVVSLVNLGGQRLGLTEGTRDVRDLDQVKLAIEGVRALLPVLEAEDAEQMRPVRDALAQLQMAYAREAGTPPGSGAPPGASPGQPPGTGGDEPKEQPRQQPERGGQGGLWVPPGSAT